MSNAELINQKLLELYKSKEYAFSQLRQKKDKWALSLMLPCVCKEFIESKIKLMIIGQETFGWGFKRSEKEVMEQTKNFLSHNRYKNSPFWHFIKQFYEALGETLENHFAPIVWNNVRKVCYDKDKGKIPQKALVGDIQELIDNHLNELLLKEIQIIQPKIVLFLTGPAYDKYIKAQLEGVEYHSIKNFLALNPDLSKSEFPNFKQRQIAVLTHKDLSDTLMFRIYHPNFYYLRVARRFPQYFETLTQICKIWNQKKLKMY